MMNTRALMALIVINVGCDLGVISQQVFTMPVLMAIFSTVIATPGGAAMAAEDGGSGAELRLISVLCHCEQREPIQSEDRREARCVYMVKPSLGD
jgi:hypothetical protein